ncbi:MAG: molybdenum cofactor biosynthesis protein MoaE [Thermaurantiacus tibetensis]|uniref:molybdenum cofactor biosynthesis protein MoaE n=1 Tax=Thermaurantiacus tibetensis TaxID=2759035 RepID=UPI00188F122A|nr:molybdenum cofactor biosynthesis protein MoaE [Thermaurantiacus tibetensis]
MFEAEVRRAPFDVAAAHARLSALGPGVGAVVLFTGQVRDEPLFLEHYPGMAERQMAARIAEARARWPLLGALAIHRFGALDVGELIVLVGTASAHRAAAFESAAFLMDWLKTSAPFWKRGRAGWVEARASDDAAARRWLPSKGEG